MAATRRASTREANMASSADVTLLSSMVERERSEGQVRTVSINLAGDADQKAIVDAVIADYHDRTDREPVSAERLETLVDHRVTLLTAGSGAFGANSITARPATIKMASGGRGLAFLPKGRRSNG
jgi:hypothetical protein